ncbi:MAG TPA: recombinase family protein [Pirellulales bacterium]|jgi:DNA invertase Pin-like site-specific DNA recombinase
MRQIAVYVRVSTKRQETRSQEPDLERWIAAYAAGAPVEWYRDKATGKTMDRPGWKRLEAEINAGGVETIVVWRLDRLGRTAAGLTALFEKLVARKVNLVSVRDGLDLATPAGRLVANMLASVAAFENEIRAERIAAGQAAARAAGKRWGGSAKGRRLKVTAEQISTIKRLRDERTPIAAIARATGLTRPTIYALIKSA